MKTDNDCNTAWLETGMQNFVQHALQLFELLIDGDPQRLKHAGRRFFS